MSTTAPDRAALEHKYREAVVRITVTGRTPGGAVAKQREGVGIVVGANGVILTVKHIVGDDADWAETGPGSGLRDRQIKVCRYDEHNQPSTPVGASAQPLSDYDAALLKTQLTGITAAPLARRPPSVHNDVIVLYRDKDHLNVLEASPTTVKFNDPNNRDSPVLALSVDVGWSGSPVFDAQGDLTALVTNDRARGECLALPIAWIKHAICGHLDPPLPPPPPRPEPVDESPPVQEGKDGPDKRDPEKLQAQSRALVEIIEWWPEGRTLPKTLIPDAQTVFDKLYDAIKERLPGVYTLTGSTGTGKTTVLQKLGVTLASDYTRTAASDAPLAIFIPLNKTELGQDVRDKFANGERNPEQLWNAIETWWLDSVNKVIKEASGKDGKPLDGEWVDAFRRRPNVIILDGLGAFLNRNAGVKVEDIVGLRGFLRCMPGTSTGGPLVVIFSGKPGSIAWEALREASSPGTSLCLSPMSEEAAKEVFGRERVDTLLARIGEFRPETMLTPLVLRALADNGNADSNNGKVDPNNRKADLNSPTRVLERALKELVKPDQDDGGTASQNKGGWVGAPAKVRMGALTAVGWAFREGGGNRQTTSGNAATRTFNEILAAAGEIEGKWRSLAAGESHSGSRAMREGFALAANEDDLRALLADSIFERSESDDGDRFEFESDTWRDVCIARYIAFSLRHRRYEALQGRTYSPRVLKGVGDLLERMIDGTLINDAIDAGGTPQFFIGNIAAMIGCSFVELDNGALDALNDRLSDIKALARHILISSLGYRAVKSDRDESSALIKQHLTDKLLEPCITDKSLRDWKWLTASLAWCFLKLLSRQADRRDFGIAWPEPTNDDRDAIFELAYPGYDGSDGAALAMHTLQAGYVSAVRGVRNDRYRLIGATHFLLMLVISARRGKSSSGVAELLAGVFHPERARDECYKTFKEKVQNLDEVPELARLFEFGAELYGR